MRTRLLTKDNGKEFKNHQNKAHLNLSSSTSKSSLRCDHFIYYYSVNLDE